MKKTISIIVALAMVFVMSFSVFATESTTAPEESTTVVETEKPTDPAELGAYYAEKFNENGVSTELAAEIAADVTAAVTEGRIDDVATMLTAFVENADDQQAAYDFLQTIETLIKTVIPDFELPFGPSVEDSTEESTEEDSTEESTLPEEEPTEGSGEDAGSGFLNTILGILGTIGDLIFGGSSGGDTDIPTDDGTTDDPFGGDDPWGDDGESDNGESDNGEGELSGGESSDAGTEDEAESENGEKEDELISDTGDTTVLSVAAVALVAGAALILTRKKSEDAE